MSDQSDGVGEFVGAALRTALTVTVLVAREILRVRAQRARAERERSEAEARRLKAELEVKRQEAHAKLAAIDRPGWIDTGPEEIVDQWRTAVTWRDQGDERATAAVDRIRELVKDKYGIDVPDPFADPDSLRARLETAEWFQGATPADISDRLEAARAEGDDRLAEWIREHVRDRYKIDVADPVVHPDVLRDTLENAAAGVNPEPSGWFEQATPAEIASRLELARTSRDERGDTWAGELVEHIREKVRDKYGFDVEDPRVHPNVLSGAIETADREAASADLDAGRPEVPTHEWGKLADDTDRSVEPPMEPIDWGKVGDLANQVVPPDPPQSAAGEPEPAAPDAAEATEPDAGRPDVRTDANDHDWGRLANEADQSVEPPIEPIDWGAIPDYADDRIARLAALGLDPEVAEAGEVAASHQGRPPSLAVAATTQPGSPVPQTSPVLEPAPSPGL